MRKSVIPEAGFGLFSKRDLPKDLDLGYYVGNVLQRENKNSYMNLRIFYRPKWIPKCIWKQKKTNNLVIDTDINDKNRCLLSFMNSTINGFPNQNCKFNNSGRFQTIEPIKKNTELICDYGKNYWK